MKRTSKFNIKKNLKSVSGMTYVELLTALALLALIITTFTPMLLSSYKSIYEAGLETQKVYDSKAQLEEGLARRDSTKEFNFEFDFDFDTTKSLTVNAEDVFKSIKAAGYKVISTSREGLETIFGYVVPRIELISPRTVYDDRTYHDIVLQTYGLKYEKVSSGKLTAADRKNLQNTLKQGEIYIEAVIPNKNDPNNTATTTDTYVYDNGYKADVQYFNQDVPTSLGALGTGSPISNETDAGRIKLRINSPADGPKIDFTYSPIKIRVYYLNKRGLLKELCTYLYIDPPTLIFAGETSDGIDYFTSAGIEYETQIDETTGENIGNKYTFEIEARAMRTDNSPFINAYYGAPGKEGVTIRNIEWIDNDTTAGLKPYYVMTGNNGAIYRMYNYSSHSTEIYGLSSFTKIGDDYTKWYGESRAQQSVIDKEYDIADGTNICSSLWSGDSTIYFEYSTYEGARNYGVDETPDNDNSWLTAQQSDGEVDVAAYTYEVAENCDDEYTYYTAPKKNTGKKTINLGDDSPKYRLFSNQAKYALYYNGLGLDFEFPYQRARNLSYILTETGSPLRLIGWQKAIDDYAGLSMIWFPWGEYDGQRYWVGAGKETYKTTNPDMMAVFTGSAGVTQDRHSEAQFAQLRTLHYGSYNPSNVSNTSIADFTENATDEGREDMRKITNGHSYLNGQESNINVTASVFIPSTDGSSGEMLYLGTTNAYMDIMQKDNYSGTENYSLELNNKKEDGKYGAVNEYVIVGSADGIGTTVHKHDDADVSFDGGISASKIKEKFAVQFSTTTDRENNLRTGDERREFFVSRNRDSDGGVWTSMYMDDFNFTFGYSSNRGKIYKNIVYDTNKEIYRGAEHLYYQSHYGEGETDETGSPTYIPKRATISDTSPGNDGAKWNYLNSADNDYYNVWFPGETYNLTQVASKDGVTVAVGYAVAGSVYQYINPAQPTNTSTALGGLYNDGVLSAMVEGQDSALTNLLYFKDNDTMDTDYLTNDFAGTQAKNHTQDLYSADAIKNVYKNAFPDRTYGTHDRQSVQFTAVDLLVENQKASVEATTADVKYYAYYGDNTGRVFKSLIATATGTASENADGSANEATISNITKVEYISDLQLSKTRASSPSIMEEMTVVGKDGVYSFNHYFKNIGTIDISGETIIITGEMQDGIDGEYFVVGTKLQKSQNDEGEAVYTDGDTITFYAVKNGDFSSKIYDAAIVGGYYYITGEGWVAGVSLETMRIEALSDGEKKIESVTSGEGINSSTNRNQLLWVSVPKITKSDGTYDRKIYAVAGRDTQ